MKYFLIYNFLILWALEEQPAVYLIVNSDLSDDTAVFLGANSGDGCQTHGDGTSLSTFDGPKVKAGEV